MDTKKAVDALQEDLRTLSHEHRAIGGTWNDRGVRVLNEKIGSGGIYLAQHLKFVNPVYIDDIVVLELTVTGIRKEKGIATIETLAKKTTGETVIKGEAMIMMAQ